MNPVYAVGEYEISEFVGKFFCTLPNCPALTPLSTGPIPPQLGQLGTLKTLALHRNKLDGELNI